MKIGILRRLNVLHIITKLELGGAQKSTLYIASLLNKDRYNLSLLSSNEGILVADALKISELNSLFLPIYDKNYSPAKEKIFEFLLKNCIIPCGRYGP